MAIIIVAEQLMVSRRPVAGKYHEGTTMPKVIDILERKNDISPTVVAFFIVTGMVGCKVHLLLTALVMHYSSSMVVLPCAKSPVFHPILHLQQRDRQETTFSISQYKS